MDLEYCVMYKCVRVWVCVCLCVCEQYMWDVRRKQIKEHDFDGGNEQWTSKESKTFSVAYTQHSVHFLSPYCFSTCYPTNFIAQS